MIIAEILRLTKEWNNNPYAKFLKALKEYRQFLDYPSKVLIQQKNYTKLQSLSAKCRYEFNFIYDDLSPAVRYHFHDIYDPIYITAPFLDTENLAKKFREEMDVLIDYVEALISWKMI